MTIEFGKGEVTFEPETVPLHERPKLLSQMPEGVYFIDRCNLVVDDLGRLRLALNCTVQGPETDEQMEDVLRVIKLDAKNYIVDRSHTFELRQAYSETDYTHAAEFCFDDQESMGMVVGIVDSPGEFTEAAPIIQKQFGIALVAITLGSSDDHER